MSFNVRGETERHFEMCKCCHLIRTVPLIVKQDLTEGHNIRYQAGRVHRFAH